MLTEEEKRELLLAAREAIRAALAGGPLAHPPAPLPGLDRHCGLFVTLKAEGRLRGCIGYIESARPLRELAPEIAVKSALDDPRFSPLTPAELPLVTIDLSVLSPLRRVRNVQEIVVGRHGLLLELGSHRGLLLPQVAVEFGWDRRAFLEATARKAGLHREAWMDSGATLFSFTAEIIEETALLHDGTAHNGATS